MTDPGRISLTGEYTLKEASELLGVTRQTLYRYCREKGLRFGVRRANGRRFFKGVELKRFFNSVI